MAAVFVSALFVAHSATPVKPTRPLSIFQSGAREVTSMLSELLGKHAP